MSKVKKEFIEAAMVKLLANITSTMPSTAYKFALGSMSALATMNNGQKIDQLLGITADSEGYVDLDMIKTAIDGGFQASGGKISIDLFKERSGLLSMLVKPITLTITKDDIEGLLKEVEDHAIADVKLNHEVPGSVPGNSTQTSQAN